jgi:quercetin dioxygenase-like cupin family protein
MQQQRTSPATLSFALIASVLLVWIALGTQSGLISGQNIFTGAPPSMLETESVGLLRLRFEAGSRSHWHSHSEGQLLLVEEGRGRTQVRGEPVREMVPGEPVYAGADVEHWHGAAPDESMIQLTISRGEVEWLEAVGDAAYLAEPTP